MTDQQAKYLETRIANLERTVGSMRKDSTVSATEPNGNFSDGDVWFDTSDGSMKAFYGGAFQSMGGGKFYVGQSNRSTTGSQAVTGVGFKPKLVLIDAVYANNPGTNSRWKATSSSNQFSKFDYQTNGSYYSGTSYASNVVNLQNYTWGGTAASLTSMDSDGFTLNWTSAAFRADFDFVCFG